MRGRPDFGCRGGDASSGTSIPQCNFLHHATYAVSEYPSRSLQNTHNNSAPTPFLKSIPVSSTISVDNSVGNVGDEAAKVPSCKAFYWAACFLIFKIV